jgi:hypothetical protein
MILGISQRDAYQDRDNEYDSPSALIRGTVSYLFCKANLRFRLLVLRNILRCPGFGRWPRKADIGRSASMTDSGANDPELTLRGFHANLRGSRTSDASERRNWFATVGGSARLLLSRVTVAAGSHLPD